jgi:drug/metabolite transporter (DMT)-like permease
VNARALSATAGLTIARRDLAALILAATCWGLGTVVSKSALDEIPPLTLLPIQLTASLVVLGILMRRQRDPVPEHRVVAAWSPRPPQSRARLRPEPDRAHHITASLSVLLWALEPLMILFLAGVFLHERITPVFVVLSIVAVAGMVAVIDAPTLSGGQLIGVALTLAGIACCRVYGHRPALDPRRQETSQVVLAQRKAHALALALVFVILVSVAAGRSARHP